MDRSGGEKSRSEAEFEQFAVKSLNLFREISRVTH